ncbi:hypothetical protein [Enterococcus faecium]|uniref:hypothetical protein n=1 Tax=Enterococcus faecium TaxID=1352 RepID=UPI00164EE5DD|nr:hypothetical protein [Enterococcus faecium]HBK5747183.1 hypothetical protein [Enterococcus faecium]
MNIIKKYELGYITYEELIEEIWGYGQKLINQVGIDCFCFYIESGSGYHKYRYYIVPYPSE